MKTEKKIKKWMQSFKCYFYPKSKEQQASINAYSLRNVERLSVPVFEEQVFNEQKENLKNVVGLIASILHLAYPQLPPSEIDRLAYKIDGRTQQNDYLKSMIYIRDEIKEWLANYRIQKIKEADA